MSVTEAKNATRSDMRGDKMAALDETDKNIEMWKIKRVCACLSGGRRSLARRLLFVSAQVDLPGAAL